MEFSGWERAIYIYFLVTLLLSIVSANGNGCSPHVSGSCGESVSLPCDFDPSFEGVYWFEESDGEEPLIRLENGYKAGRGYESHEYDVLKNGSLVIKNTQFTNDQQYKVILLDSEFRDDTFTVDFSVTENCPSRVTGSLTTVGVISCCFNPESEGVYWFEEHDDIEPLIRSESGKKFGQGYDSHEYDMLPNGSLVIKNVRHTHEQIYKVILLDTEFREKTIFVDFSVTVGLSDCPSPQKGLLGEPSTINCHFNADFKRVSWIVEDSDNDTLIQREGSTISGPGFTDNKYNVSNDGSLVIRRVSEENNARYRVIFVDVNNNSFTYRIDFEAETHCTKLPQPNHGTVIQTAKLAEYNCEEGFHLNNNALVECILDDATDTYYWSGPIPKCVRDIVTTTTVATTTVATKTVATTPKMTTTKIYSSTKGSPTTNTPRPTLNDKNVHMKTRGRNTDKVHPTTKRGGSNGSHLRVQLAVITLAAITPFLF
ncbi:hypothetical protein BSL78_16356 [Apostichopus japonicus]|uniref:Sushi domain-containing protein n=1 Tax=Stichopus japonicus TaxID=307972 RepID=A0A2G8KFH6_STIJA|nr:hypothetical protein BSL78_16356 [Apostichopus japonicus]